jgi:hypothetical protein
MSEGKLAKLLARCKCGVYLAVNEHRDVYESVEEHLIDAAGRECPPQIEPDVRRRMIETDTIVKLHFYPDTPIGSYEVWHYDLDAALDRALSCL